MAAPTPCWFTALAESPLGWIWGNVTRIEQKPMGNCPKEDKSSRLPCLRFRGKQRRKSACAQRSRPVVVVSSPRLRVRASHSPGLSWHAPHCFLLCTCPRGVGPHLLFPGAVQLRPGQADAGVDAGLPVSPADLLSLNAERLVVGVSATQPGSNCSCCWIYFCLWQDFKKLEGRVPISEWTFGPSWPLPSCQAGLIRGPCVYWADMAPAPQLTTLPLVRVQR